MTEDQQAGLVLIGVGLILMGLMMLFIRWRNRR